MIELGNQSVYQQDMMRTAFELGKLGVNVAIVRTVAGRSTAKRDATLGQKEWLQNCKDEFPPTRAHPPSRKRPCNVQWRPWY